MLKLTRNYNDETNYRYTAGVGGDDGEDKNKKSVKKKLKGGGEDNLKVFVAGTMTNWESWQMARTDDGFIVVLECQEGDVYYKFFVSDGDRCDTTLTSNIL